MGKKNKHTQIHGVEKEGKQVVTSHQYFEKYIH